jgi:Ubiquitin-activating enzyme E1 FCCH domain
MSTQYQGNPANVSGELTRLISAMTGNGVLIAVTTSVPHFYSTGDSVTIRNVLGNTAANGTWTITVTGSTTFTLNGSTGNGAYISGGSVTDLMLLPPIPVPSDGDASPVASVNVAIEGLADDIQATWVEFLGFANGFASQLQDITIRNWNPIAINDTTGTAIVNNANVRADGTASIMWSQTFGVWLMFGHSASSGIYASVDGQTWTLFGIGSGGPFCFGVEAGTRLIYFNGAATTNVNCCNRTNGTTLNTTTLKTLPVTAGSIASFALNHAITLGTGTVIAVGGYTITSVISTITAWVSTDQGNTFTEVSPFGTASGTGGPYLNRIIGGPTSASCVTWIKGSAVQNGNVLYYSTNSGTSWGRRTMAFNTIVSGVFANVLPVGIYMFATSDGVVHWITGDVSSADVFDDATFTGATIYDMACLGSKVIISTSTGLWLYDVVRDSAWSRVLTNTVAALVGVGPFVTLTADPVNGAFAAWMTNAACVSLRNSTL